MPLNEGRDRNPGDTAGHLCPLVPEVRLHRRARSTKAGTVIPATPAGHPASWAKSRRHAASRSLNEGRDRNPGDTDARRSRDTAQRPAPRSTKAGTVIPATPASRDRAGATAAAAPLEAAVPATLAWLPSSSWQLNEGRDRNPGEACRSTKAGTVIPATPRFDAGTSEGREICHGAPALNEGRDRNPGDTASQPLRRRDRGESSQIRSTKAGTVIPATPEPLRVAVVVGAARSTKAGTVIPATRPGSRTLCTRTVIPRQTPATFAGRRGGGSLNEGRDRNPATQASRSTKAGTVIPATLLNLEEWPVWRKSHEWKHGRYRGIAENPINSVCFAVPIVANPRD